MHQSIGSCSHPCHSYWRAWRLCRHPTHKHTHAHTHTERERQAMTAKEEAYLLAPKNSTHINGSKPSADYKHTIKERQRRKRRRREKTAEEKKRKFLKILKTLHILESPERYLRCLALRFKSEITPFPFPLPHTYCLPKPTIHSSSRIHKQTHLH